MSRPIKLDDLIEKRVCDALRKGHSYETAAQLAGIAPRTLHYWRERGRDGDPDFVQFLQRVERAEAEAVDRWVQVIQDAMDGEDRKVSLAAAQWMLERRRPQEWGTKRSEVEQPMTVEEAERLVREATELAKRAG